MNNLRLCNNWSAKVLLSAVLSVGTVAEAYADTQYGPLKAGETLSSIVNENYLISPFQNEVIMREIFRMNPQAFISNNIGLVKQGVMLKLPSDATIRRAQQQVSNAQASQSRSSARELTQSLEATLRQARKDRDEAKQQLRRVEVQSAEQIESFNSRIRRLESDKEVIAQQLEVSSKELASTKQSLEAARLDNSQSLVKAESANIEADGEITKQLEESSRLLEQKQQQVNELELSVSELKATTKNLEASHALTLDGLQKKNKTLEEALAAQQQANSSNSDSEQVEARIAELKLQHQQQLKQLQTSFEAKNAEQQNSDANGLAAGSINTNLATDSATLANGPITKQFLIQQLEKPVAFPLWGLLLAAFALGFTSLMMLLTKSRRPVNAAVSASLSSSSQVVENKIEEKLVFRASDQSAQDPDIETLRAPPRRDPSRVAILDPTMVADNRVMEDKNPIADSQKNSLPEEVLAVDDAQNFDAKFKLLLAETYEELGDNLAANELLLEVVQEGNENQKKAASAFLARLELPK